MFRGISNLSKGTRFLVPKTSQKFNYNYLPKIQTRNYSEFTPLLLDNLPLALAAGTVGGSTLLGGTFFAMRYRISKADQYLVRTGLGIQDIKITKKGLQWPFQDYRYLEMRPKNYEFNLHAMSNQKMEFILPGVFTIGPKNEEEALMKYARYLLNGFNTNNTKDLIDDLVKGVIEGETRVLAAQMTIEEIFKDRAKFKSTIINSVQEELDQFGLVIFNANIKELQDTPGSEYFSYLRQKTRSEAEGQARVDTSEARKKADIGEKEREMETRKQTAEYEALAVEKENDTRKRIAESAAELEIVQQEAIKRTNIAKIEAEQMSKMREVDLQKDVEQKRFEQEVQANRATDLSKANVAADTIKVGADAKLYEQQRAADAQLYQQQKDAEAKLYNQQKDAEAHLYNQQKSAEGVLVTADAKLYDQEKNATGILAVYEANSQGNKKMIESFGDGEKYLQYLMFDKEIYDKLAKANAEAVKGMNPKITVWKTGNSGDNDYTDTMKNVMQNLPPLLTTIHDQTGLKPAEWMVQGLDKKE